MSLRYVPDLVNAEAAYGHLIRLSIQITTLYPVKMFFRDASINSYTVAPVLGHLYTVWRLPSDRL